MSTQSMLLPQTLDVRQTLFCGQNFLWQERIANCFFGSAGDNIACIRPDGDAMRLIWQGTADEAWWQRYFDLTRDYACIGADFASDPAVSAAFAACRGLHVLRQPIWETLICFILSSNNNDKRIRSLTDSLCQSFGEKGELEGQSIWQFPSPQALCAAGEERLRALKLGYRAAYVADTAKRICTGFALDTLPCLGYEQALAHLMTLHGVGEKVADCILLFSCGYDCAFPVDVWIERIMTALYGAEKGGRKAIKREGRKRFGAQAGIVQQMLFHHARTIAAPAPH